MKPIIFGLALIAFSTISSIYAREAGPALAGGQPPYSCRLYYDEQKKCAFGSCDVRTLERLKRECLRDGGRP